MNLGVDAYVSFSYGSHNISYVTSGGNSAFDGSVQIHGLSFDGIIGKETSVSVGKIVLNGFLIVFIKPFFIRSLLIWIL